MKKLEVRMIKNGYGTNSSSYNSAIEMNSEQYKKWINNEIVYLIYEKEFIPIADKKIEKKYGIKYNGYNWEVTNRTPKNEYFIQEFITNANSQNNFGYAFHLDYPIVIFEPEKIKKDKITVDIEFTNMD